MDELGRVIGGFIAFPFRVLGYLFSHKVALILVIAAIGFLIYTNYNSDKAITQTDGQYSYIQEIAPPKTVAPIMGQTQSRGYYIVEFSDDGETVTLLHWFDYNKDEWQEHKTPLPFSKSEIKILQR